MKLEFIDKPLTIQEPPNFTVVSTFSGCGGSSTGYVWAGGKVLLAVEWDDNAVETYRLNYPDTLIYHGDIAQLSVEECLERTGLQVGELDILDGSPPCQGFSMVGKRVIEDPRNQLFQEYVRLLRGLKPKVFVMENVSGMVKGKMKLTFAEIMRELKASGYKVSARLLNAMYFGVPQSRQRMIFIGVRENLGIEPSHPKAQNRPISVKSVFETIIPITTIDNPKGADLIFPYIKQGKSTIQCVPKELLAQYVPKMVNNKTFSFGGMCKRLHPDFPAPTITKTFIYYSEPFIHPYENRHPAIEELSAIASFPSCYQWYGTYKERWERIGNSVPPMFMKAIADHIWKCILEPIKV